MIVCITPNPALDHTLIIPSLRLGVVQRANQTIITAGGKGVNVARAIRTLDGDPLCMGFLGGYIGRQMAELVEHEGLRSVWTWVADETRFSLILNDPDRCESTVINGHGSVVTANDWARLQIKVTHAVRPVTQVCISGSLPPGSPLDAYTGLIRTLIDSGKTVWIDTSGTALRAALQIAGIGVKVNGDEIGTLLHREVKTIGKSYEAPAELRSTGLNAVIVTLGQSGAVSIDAEGGWHAWPPSIQVVNVVGSGDAFLGEWVTALTNHLPASEALRW